MAQQTSLISYNEREWGSIKEALFNYSYPQEQCSYMCPLGIHTTVYGAWNGALFVVVARTTNLEKEEEEEEEELCYTVLERDKSRKLRLVVFLFRPLACFRLRHHPFYLLWLHNLFLSWLTKSRALNGNEWIKMKTLSLSYPLLYHMYLYTTVISNLFKMYVCSFF